MAPDEPTPVGEPYDPEELEDEEQRPRRSLYGLVLMIVAVVVIIVILLLLRNCGGADSGAETGGDKVIVRVAGLEPVDGVVSVWISEDVAIADVLASAGVRSESVLNMGGGRYVVETGRGSEARAIAAIKRTAGVNDAGRVFQR